MYIKTLLNNNQNNVTKSNVETKMENTEKRRKLMNHLNIVSAFTGFLGAINSMAIGFYLLSILFNPTQISNSIIQDYIVASLTVIVTAALIYGGFLILKNKNIKRGAVINFIAGLILTVLYIYYAYFAQPSLLGWLTPIGILLIIPPILSGIIGKIALD